MEKCNLTKLNSLKAKNISQIVYERYTVHIVSQALSYLTGGSGGVLLAGIRPPSVTTVLLESV